MNEIGVVTITGIDLEPDGRVRVTVHSAQPYGSAVNPAERSFTWIGTASGNNIMDACKNLRSTATKKLVWVHCKIFIVGERMAREEFKKAIDFFSRNREIRYNSYILVTEGTAFDMMQVPASVQRNLANEIEGMVENIDDWSKAHASDLKNFLVCYAQEHSGCVTAKVGYRLSDMDVISTNSEEYRKFALAGEKLGIAYIMGSAVFDGCSLAGWLDGSQTRGYMWITDKVKPGVIVAGNFRKGEEMGMESMYSKSRIDVQMNEGRLAILVKLKVSGRLVEHNQSYKIKDEDDMDKVEDIFERRIAEEMESAVKMAKSFNSDIFGFYRQICMEYPEMRDRLREEWDDIFPRLSVGYEVDVNLNRTGMVLERVLNR